MRRWQLVLVAILWAPGAGILRAADRPNFVWLISEDNSKHYLELFDSHGAATPHIAELASHGLIFERAFSNAPVCSVARTTLMTGCYGPRIGTQFHRHFKRVPMPQGLRMFPAYLRQVGYYTTNRQKKDYNAEEGEGVWDASSRQATWRDRKDGQPFFHMQSFATTHESSLHFPARDVRNTPTQTDPSSVFVPSMFPDTEIFRYTIARYHDRIQEVDRQIGAVVAQLADEGLLEDTFVFYFGDHGGVLPGSKGYLYETGLHVPLVVRIPDNWRQLVAASAGDRVHEFVSFIDFGPTVLKLAGLNVPAGMDGQPFLGIDATQDERRARQDAFGYADRFDEKYDFVRSLRRGNYKYIRSYQPFNVDALQNNYRYRMLAYREWRAMFRAGELNELQSQFFLPRPPEALYDLTVDPYELNNLADDPAHETMLVSMRRDLARRVREMPDLSFYPESYLVENAFDDPVAFGRRQADAIARLADIADLSLQDYDEVRSQLAELLDAKDSWQRYWACIVCSVFGEKASEFQGKLATIAQTDFEPLVRTRAAESLGLMGVDGVDQWLEAALAEATSGVEAALILNTIVLMKDSPKGYEFSISVDQLPERVRSNDAVKRRLEYLNGD